MIITIYGNRKKSHDHINNISESSSKTQSEWYITSWVNISFWLFPIWEIFCRGPNYESINQWINESIKNVTIFWNDKERFLTTLRTRNYRIWKRRQPTAVLVLSGWQSALTLAVDGSREVGWRRVRQTALACQIDRKQRHSSLVSSLFRLYSQR
jgi:hypothetical protein